MSKRALGSLKAGHTGTLDPFATGLLPLVFGEATKFSRFLIDSDKTYLATLRLGATSSTGDTEGVVSPGGPIPTALSEIAAISQEMIGVSTQIPPMHSAVRVQGRRLYDLARQGVEVEREARHIRIDFLDIVEFSGEKLVISLKCSKGTYVRTLAESLGKRLGCGAYLTDLRRTETGGFRVEDAVAPEALAEMGVESARARLLPVEVLVRTLPRSDLAESEAWAIRNGQELPAEGWEPGETALFGPGGAFLGVGKVAGGRLAAARLMATGAAG
jgi:tRNA pseudouridine55 synthase